MGSTVVVCIIVGLVIYVLIVGAMGEKAKEEGSDQKSHSETILPEYREEEKKAWWEDPYMDDAAKKWLHDHPNETGNFHF